MEYTYFVDLSSWFVLAFLLFTFANGVLSAVLGWLDANSPDVGESVKRLHALGKLAKKLFTKRNIEATLEYKSASENFSNMTSTIDSGVNSLILLFGVVPMLVATFHAHFPNLSMMWCWVLTSTTVTVVASLLQAPAEWYDEFVIDGRFGLSNSTLGTFVSDKLKSTAIATFASIALVVPLDWALRRYVGGGDLEDILYFCAAYVFATTFISPIVGWFTFPMFNKVYPLADGPLRKRLTRLCRKCGWRWPAIYVMDDSSRSSRPNAFIMNVFWNKKVLLSDNLVSRYSPDEIEAIVGHEIGHGKLHHFSINYLKEILFGVVGVAATVLLVRTPSFYRAFGYSWVTQENVAENFIMGFFLAETFKTAFTWILDPAICWMSRKMEYAADRYSAERIRSKSSMVNALLRLYSDNLSDLFPHPACEWMTYTHPSILNRVGAIVHRRRKTRRKTSSKKTRDGEDGESKTKAL